MITWLRHHPFIVGTALIVIVNAVALAGVAYNRSGDPDSILHLSQRELQLPYSLMGNTENSGIALTLNWRVPVEEATDTFKQFMYYPGSNGIPAWMSKAKMESLGFNVTEIKGVEDGGKHYRKLVSKDVLLVMELDGSAYQQKLLNVRQYAASTEAAYAASSGNKELEQQLANAKKNVMREEQENSRLFVVDAGLDIGTLRTKYPDRTHYAIIHGQVRPQITMAGNRKDQLFTGIVSSLSITQINVPVKFRKVFEHLSKNDQAGMNTPSARYEAELAFGKRLEPWLTAVTDNLAVAQ